MTRYFLLAVEIETDSDMPECHTDLTSLDIPWDEKVDINRLSNANELFDFVKNLRHFCTAHNYEVSLLDKLITKIEGNKS